MQATRNILTNFPQPCSQVFVLVKHSGELIAMVQHAHQAQQVLRRYCLIHVIISKQVVRGFDQEQLQHTFDYDLLENSSSLVDGNCRAGSSLFAVWG